MRAVRHPDTAQVHLPEVRCRGGGAPVGCSSRIRRNLAAPLPYGDRSPAVVLVVRIERGPDDRPPHPPSGWWSAPTGA